MEQRAGQHAVAQDEAREDERHRCKNDDDAIAEGERTRKPGQERIVRGRADQLALIFKRAVHHATSDASFIRLAQLALFAE